jgi:hypothetical protein
MAAVLLIYAILMLIEVIKALPSTKTLLAKIVGFIQPVGYLVVALCLLFNQGGTVDWVFILAGIFFIVQAALALVDCLATRKD